MPMAFVRDAGSQGMRTSLQSKIDLILFSVFNNWQSYMVYQFQRTYLKSKRCCYHQYKLLCRHGQSEEVNTNILAIAVTLYEIWQVSLINYLGYQNTWI